MILSKFEVDLYQKLGDFFKPHGFEQHKDQKQFHKTTQNGSQNIIFSIIEFEKDFLIGINFRIRNTQIEQIVQQFLNLHKNNKTEANTLSIKVGKNLNLKEFRFKNNEEDDLEKVFDAVKDYFEETGFRFLNKMTTLNEIDILLNDAPFEPCKNTNNQLQRCFRGVVAAKLVDNQMFHSLCNIYRKYLLINANEHYLISYERLLAFLIYYSPN